MLRSVLAMFIALALVPASAGAQPAPIEIPTMLAITGNAAFLGQGLATTLKVVEQYTNANGGINGRPVKFVIQDTQSNPSLAVQFTNATLAKKPAIMLGPGFGPECLAISPLVKNGPVDYCLSPTPQPPPHSYIYSAGLGAEDYPLLLLRYFKAKHWNRVVLITSTDASGQIFDTLIDQTLARPEFAGMRLVEREHFGVTDISVAAQIARMKAASPNVAILWTPGVAFGTLLRSAQDAGLDIPLAGGPGNMSYPQMAQYANFLPKVLLFPAASSVAEGGVGPGPIRDAQTVYFNAFKKYAGKPDFLESSVWDAATLVVEAYRKLGPDATAEQFQHYFQTLHGWVGIMGVYDFRDGSQRGIGASAGVVAAWSAAKHDFVVVSKLGGLPK